MVALASMLVSSNVMPQGGDPDQGAAIYSQKCIGCHGSAGEGASGPSLRGCSICDSFEDLFDKINSEMPQDNPNDCIDTCAYDTAAYIFVNLNGNSLATDDGGGCFIILSIEFSHRVTQSRLIRYQGLLHPYLKAPFIGFTDNQHFDTCPQSRMRWHILENQGSTGRTQK